MMNRLHALAQAALLLFVFSGCSEEVRQTSSTPEIVLGADPAATILEIFGMEDRFARTENLISVLREIPADQVDAFEAALNGLADPHREIDRLLVLTAWANYDAPAATRWAMNDEPVDLVRDVMFGESVYLWTLKDHESFLSDPEIAESIQPHFGPAILRPFVMGWFDSGAPGLETYIRDMIPSSADRGRAVDTLVEIKTERDGAAAMVEWAKALPGETDYKTLVNSRVAAEVVLLDSELIVNWCIEICNTELGKGMLSMIANSWVMESPEEAMDFVTSQHGSIGVQIGSRSAYNRFLKADEERAFAWMEATTEERRRGPIMQGPVASYANRRSAGGNNLIALNWLEYIQDEEDRELGQIQIARRWLRIHEDEAEAWMAQSPMSEEAQFEAHQSSLRGPIKR